jgi:hypothetical protein
MIQDLKKKSLIKNEEKTIELESDQPITNFEELVAKHMKERNMLFHR